VARSSRRNAIKSHSAHLFFASFYRAKRSLFVIFNKTLNIYLRPTKLGDARFSWTQERPR
jgi:hypothetical protein